MTSAVLTSGTIESLKNYLEETPNAELVSAYLFCVEKKQHIKPVIYPKEKKIYQSERKLLESLEKREALWHETEIKINFSKGSVNEDTQRVYICPFTGKVFGDNTHPNPQDAIYDWVSKCPENNERKDGMRVKRFYVSEDHGVISEYATKAKEKARNAVTKKVFSSVLNGKIFSTKDAVIKDFRKNYIKPVSLIDVPSQSKFEIEEEFLSYIQSLLEEDKITNFIETLSTNEEFLPYITNWIGEDDE